MTQEATLEKWNQRFSTIEKSIIDKDYSAAESALAEALVELEASDGNERAALHCLEKMAECHWYLGKLESAKEHCNRVIDIYKQSPESSTLPLVAFTTNRAMICHSAKKVEDAGNFYREALELTRHALGEDHSYTNKLKSLYADLLSIAGKEDEAKALGTAPRDVTITDWLNTRLIEMLATRKAEELESSGAHPTQSTVADETIGKFQLSKEEAKLIYDSNKYTADSALREGHYAYGEKLWEINCRLLETFDVGGPIYSSTLEKLAEISNAQGNYEAATNYAKKAYDYLLEELGPKSVPVARTANLLAQINYLRSDYESAEPFAKQCVEIYEKLEPRNEQFLASALHNLATLYHVQRKYDHAEKAYKTSLEIKNRVFGPDHPETKRLLNSYAELLKQMTPAPSQEKVETGMITGSWKIAGKSSKLKIGAVTSCDICGTDFTEKEKCPNCGYDPKFGF